MREKNNLDLIALRLVTFIFVMFIWLLFILSSCSPKIITRTIKRDSLITNLKVDTIITIRNDTVIKTITQEKIVEKVITIKEDCKDIRQIRQEQRTKRDSIRYIYKTVRDTVYSNNKTIRDTVRVKERTQRQENRQEGRTNRGTYFWLLLLIVSFLFGYNFKYLFNVNKKK